MFIFNSFCHKKSGHGLFGYLGLKASHIVSEKLSAGPKASRDSPGADRSASKLIHEIAGRFNSLLAVGWRYQFFATWASPKAAHTMEACFFFGKIVKEWVSSERTRQKPWSPDNLVQASQLFCHIAILRSKSVNTTYTQIEELQKVVDHRRQGHCGSYQKLPFTGTGYSDKTEH